MDTIDLLNHADSLGLDAIEYLEEYLYTDPVFAKYQELLDLKKEMNRQKEELLYKNYPILEHIKRTPFYDHTEELKNLLINPNYQNVLDEIYLLLIDYYKGKEESLVYAKALCELKDTKENRAIHGKVLFDLKHYEEAFSLLSSAIPFSLYDLGYCYFYGLGTKKDPDYFTKLIEDECRRDERVVSLYQRFLTDYFHYSSAEISRIINPLYLTSRDKYNLLIEIKVKGYITDQHFLLSYDEEKKKLAYKFLEQYDIPVFTYNKKYEDNELELLKYFIELYTIIDDDPFSYDSIFNEPFWSDIQRIADLNLNPEHITFFFEEGNKKPMHSPGEAALFFDMSSTKAFEELIKLENLLDTPILKDKLKKYVYWMDYYVYHRK